MTSGNDDERGFMVLPDDDTCDECGYPLDLCDCDAAAEFDDDIEDLIEQADDE